MILFTTCSLSTDIERIFGTFNLQRCDRSSKIC